MTPPEETEAELKAELEEYEKFCEEAKEGYHDLSYATERIMEKSKPKFLLQLKSIRLKSRDHERAFAA